MTADEITQGCATVPAWQCDGASLSREFRFANFDATMAFVNAVADIARRQDHHPDMTVGYSTVGIRYSSHDVGGLSPRDFRAASAVDQLSRL